MVLSSVNLALTFRNWLIGCAWAGQIALAALGREFSNRQEQFCTLCTCYLCSTSPSLCPPVGRKGGSFFVETASFLRHLQPNSLPNSPPTNFNCVLCRSLGSAKRAGETSRDMTWTLSRNYGTPDRGEELLEQGDLN